MESTSDLLNILQYLLTENETCIEDSKKQCSRVRYLVDSVQETMIKLQDEVKLYQVFPAKRTQE